VAELLKGNRRTVEAREWTNWLSSAARLAQRFEEEWWDDPFAYNETASVSFLTGAAIDAGLLALAEFSFRKKNKDDRRARAVGRIDFWLATSNRSWAIEFKQLTDSRVSESQLWERMGAADRDAAHVVTYDDMWVASGLVVPLYYCEGLAREKAIRALDAFVQECDYAWRISSRECAPSTYFFFNAQRPS